MPIIHTRRSALQLGLKAGGAAAAVAAFPTFISSVHAQGNWPTKPIRLLVPFAPGGSSEIVARSAANEISKTLGQTVFGKTSPAPAATLRCRSARPRPTATP